MDEEMELLIDRAEAALRKLDLCNKNSLDWNDLFQYETHVELALRKALKERSVYFYYRDRTGVYADRPHTAPLQHKIRILVNNRSRTFFYPSDMPFRSILSAVSVDRVFG